MKLYFSGIAGTGIKPLAVVAAEAGNKVFGSDLGKRPRNDELAALGVEIAYGSQDGNFLRTIHEKYGVDWFVHTSALPKDHPELEAARELGLKISKRDEFLANLIKTQGLKLVAVAGTHGKTTTTAMVIWGLHRLGREASYIVGTDLSWGTSGNFTSKSEYFVYEADEYDRNFLSYEPWLSAITVEDYDHPDIYPTEADYHAAFAQFRRQSQNVVENIADNPQITLVGELRRKDASLALAIIKKMHPDIKEEKIIEVLNDFPGAGRRFERLAKNLYSDYGHHPQEIQATLEMARELAEKDNLTGVVIVYQPHQNIRQVENKDKYKNAFLAADKVIWLPTFLTREDPRLRVIEPKEFIEGLANREAGETAELDDDLKKRIEDLLVKNYLVILLSAGPADDWLRDNF